MGSLDATLLSHASLVILTRGSLFTNPDFHADKFSVMLFGDDLPVWVGETAPILANLSDD